MNPHMELSGFLLKQGAKGLFKGWKKRWCRFKFGKLFYSETQTDAQPLGFIDVDSCSDVRVTSSSAIGGFSFEIVLPNRTYALKCSNIDDLKYWLDGINAYRELRKLNPLMEKATALEDEKQRLRSQVLELERKVRDSVSMSASTPVPEEESVEVPLLQREVKELRARLSESEKMRVALDGMMEQRTAEFVRERTLWQEEKQALVAWQERRDERKGKEKILLDEVRNLREQLQHAQAQNVAALAVPASDSSSPSRLRRAREIAEAEARLRDQEEEHGRARIQLSMQVEKDDDERPQVSTLAPTATVTVAPEDASVEMVGQLCQELSELNEELQDPFLTSILATLSDITRSRTKKFGASVKGTLDQLSGRVRGEPARSVLNKLLKVMSVVAVDAGWEEVASLPRSETPEPPVGASGLSSSATPAAAAAAASATVANAETTVAGSCVQCPDRQCGRFLPHAFKRNQCRICYHGADQHTAEPFGPQITETPDAGTISPRTEGVLRASSNKVGISRMRSSVMISEKEGEGARSPREKPVSQAMNRRKSWADVGGSKALMRENGTIDVAELALRAEDSTFVMEPNLLKEIILQLKALDQSREESKAAKSALDQLRDQTSKEAASIAMESFKMREQHAKMKAKEEEARTKLIELSMETTVTIQQLRDDLTKKVAELDEVKMSVSELSDALSSKEAQLTNTEALRFTAVSEAKSLREQLAALLVRAEDAEDAVEAASARSEKDLERVTTQNRNETEALVASHKVEVEELQKKREQLQKSFVEKEEQLKKSAESEKTSFVKQLQDKENALAALQKSFVEKEEQLKKIFVEKEEQLKKSFVEKEEQLKKSAESEKTSFVKQLQDKENALAALQKSFVEKEEQLKKSAESEKTSFVKQLQDKENALAALQKSFVEKEEQLKKIFVEKEEQLKKSFVEKEEQLKKSAESEKTSFVKQLQDKENALAALQKSFVEKEEQLKKSAESEKTSFVKQLQEKEAALAVSQKEVAEVLEELAKLKVDFSHVASQKVQLDELLLQVRKESEKEVFSVREELAAQTSRLQQEGGAALKAVSIELETLKVVHRDLERRALESSKEVHANHVAELKRVSDEHEKVLLGVRAEIEAEKGRREELEKNLKQVHGLELDVLQKEIALKSRDVSDLISKLESVEGQVASLVKEKAEAAAEGVRHLQEAGVCHAQEVGELKKRIAHLEAESDKLRKDHAVAVEALENSRKALSDEMHAMFAVKQREHDDFTASLRQDLALQTARLQQEGDVAVKALSEEIESLKASQLEKEMMWKSKLEQDLADQASRFEEAQKNVAEAHSAETALLREEFAEELKKRLALRDMESAEELRRVVGAAKQELDAIKLVELEAVRMQQRNETEALLASHAAQVEQLQKERIESLEAKAEELRKGFAVELEGLNTRGGEETRREAEMLKASFAKQLQEKADSWAALQKSFVEKEEQLKKSAESEKESALAALQKSFVEKEEQLKKSAESEETSFAKQLQEKDNAVAALQKSFVEKEEQLKKSFIEKEEQLKKSAESEKTSFLKLLQEKENALAALQKSSVEKEEQLKKSAESEKASFVKQLQEKDNALAALQKSFVEKEEQLKKSFVEKEEQLKKSAESEKTSFAKQLQDKENALAALQKSFVEKEEQLKKSAESEKTSFAKQLQDKENALAALQKSSVEKEEQLKKSAESEETSFVKQLQEKDNALAALQKSFVEKEEHFNLQLLEEKDGFSLFQKSAELERLSLASALSKLQEKFDVEQVALREEIDSLKSLLAQKSDELERLKVLELAASDRNLKQSDSSHRLEALAKELDDAKGRLEEFEEHVADLQEELESSAKRAKELEKMVLDGKKHINALMQQNLEKDRALASVNGASQAEELLTRLEKTEKQKLEQDLVLLDLKEEYSRLEKMSNASNSALLRAEEELEAVRNGAALGGLSRVVPGSIEQLVFKYEATLRQQQQHNVFLSRELDRLETEQQAVIAAKDKTVAFILHSLKENQAEMQSLRRSLLLKEPMAASDLLAKQESVEQLRQQLFFAKAVACKVDRATRNLKTNLNVSELWERAKFIPVDQFDRLIQFELEGSGQSPKKK